MSDETTLQQKDIFYADTSLKDYYKSLQVMYTNAVNMITAINQSLTSSSSKVYVNIVGASGNTKTTVELPSLLYLENKIEELENGFTSLFNITKSGEAWFSKSSDMFKLQLVKSSSAPVQPIIEGASTDLKASIRDNNFLRDLVSPKMVLKVNISNIPDNVEKVFMKKIIISNAAVFNQLKNMNISSYEETAAALYTLRKGIDYEEYDSTIDLPVKNDPYVSEFRIEHIPQIEGGNPWISNSSSSRRTYRVQLSTMQYHGSDDTSIEYTLRPGDYVCLGNTSTVYKVTNVDITKMSADIEEYIGHTALTTFENNNQMVLSIYNDSYAHYNYVEVPLEENQFICVFIGIVYNNVRSTLSSPILIDLGSIYMYDQYGNKILDSNGNHMTYIEYYDKYCNNIGDLILGLTQSAYPQISNYSNDVIYTLLNSDVMKDMVNASINGESLLQVVPINKHLIDTTTTEEIINLHSQKSDLNSQLNSLKDNIDSVYNSLVSTDFSKEVDITQESLQSQLQGYYSQRINLQKQLNAVIDNINAVSADVTIARDNTKYRIRGITNTQVIDTYLHTFGNDKLDIIGMECEYKYKSPLKDNTSVMDINSNVFTDWNKLPSVDKQRKLVFNSTLSSFSVEYVDYSSTQNIIKWNQIDIPITRGEDVVLRIRYKYNLGQPFIDLYSPWSDEIVMMFPTEYMDAVEVSSILAANEADTMSARFREALLDEGYQEHINNSLTVGDRTFFHMPENIYSGFNTPENNMINLKDKLTDLSNDLAQTKNMIESEVNKKYTVYLNYDEGNVELFHNNINRVSIWNNDHITDSFIKKKMNLIIKNTGDVDVKFYSIFPGNTDIPLLLSNNEFYEQRVRHYERVPMFVNNELSYQTLGQWIYFRQDNAFTAQDVYLDDSAQNLQDYRMLNSNAANLYFTALNSYIMKDYSQALLGYRKRNSGEIRNIMDVQWMGLDWQGDGTFKQLMSTMEIEEADVTKYTNKDISFFFYQNDLSNNYLTRFEDICGTNELGTTIFLDEDTSISEFISLNTVNGIEAGTATFTGAFLYPDLLSRSAVLTDGKDAGFIKIETGKSLSIPVTFEYALDGERLTKITKALYFDIRDSLDLEPQHFMLEITANYDFSASGNAINNFGI